jgi:hypothetical protein
LTDQIALGVLTATFTRALVNEVIEVTGRREQPHGIDTAHHHRDPPRAAAGTSPALQRPRRFVERSASSTSNGPSIGPGPTRRCPPAPLFASSAHPKLFVLGFIKGKRRISVVMTSSHNGSPLASADTVFGHHSRHDICHGAADSGDRDRTPEGTPPAIGEDQLGSRLREIDYGRILCHFVS